MPKSYQRTTIILPEAVMIRAKNIVHHHQLKGGMTRLVCDALEAHLDHLEKVPLSFDIVWIRQMGREPTQEEKVACYGGRYKQQQKIGDPFYTPMDWWTREDLRSHWASSTWDSSTARLIYAQQQTWLLRGYPLVMLPIEPPGWMGYPPVPKEEPEEDLQDDDIA